MGLFRIIQNGKEAVITLKMHQNEIDRKLSRLSQEPRSATEPSNMPNIQHMINLPQLSLPTFNGDPREWRQFWSSFSAAVHSQTIPEIQKLNYLLSCLRGKALQVVSGYEIAPENYEVIRRLLGDKYGDPSTIKTILYSELQAIKKKEKEWIGTHKYRNLNRRQTATLDIRKDTNQKTIIPKPEQISRSNFGRTQRLLQFEMIIKEKFENRKEDRVFFVPKIIGTVNATFIPQLTLA
ncbi:unnamed protein product [Onchocerca ochengi]|uniref:Gag protein n=1 Tax=Onchocerca ochengi TaxID=42157 RepID=A0A182ERM3_ONCOC|nr:unnamed protein product [Onchocerca ochengi]